MNKDQVKGAAKEAKGNVKEAFGKATDNRSTQVEGKIDKNVGATQRKAGDLKEDIKDANKR